VDAAVVLFLATCSSREKIPGTVCGVDVVLCIFETPAINRGFGGFL